MKCVDIEREQLQVIRNMPIERLYKEWSLYLTNPVPCNSSPYLEQVLEHLRSQADNDRASTYSAYTRL